MAVNNIHRFQVLVLPGTVGVAFTLTLSATFACATSLFGQTDSVAIASLRRAAACFGWSTVALTVEVQLATLSQHLIFFLVDRDVLTNNTWSITVMEILQSVAIALLVIGVILAGEGTKIIDRNVGVALQWCIAPFALLHCGVYCVATFKVSAYKRFPHHKAKTD